MPIRDDFWWPLRKTYIIVYLTYGHAHAKLFAENIQVRPGDTFEVSVDLTKNLRTRSKGSSTYVDARDLADGQIRELKTIQIDDHGVLNDISNHLGQLEGTPTMWRLRVQLDGSEHWFTVEPSYRESNAYEALTFTVL